MISKVPIKLVNICENIIIFVMFYVGKMIHSMVAHLDAVTSLAVDPNGIYLMSGSKSEFPVLCTNFIKELLLKNTLFVLLQAMIVLLDCGIWTARHVCKK